VSHIPKFGDASKSPSGDTASPAGDAASLSGDAVVAHWRCIISFRDAHPPHSHPHLQIPGYVTLLFGRLFIFDKSEIIYRLGMLVLMCDNIDRCFEQ
jgi:hypothetical protein